MHRYNGYWQSSEKDRLMCKNRSTFNIGSEEPSKLCLYTHMCVNDWKLTVTRVAMRRHVVFKWWLALKPVVLKMSLTLSLRQSTCQTTCPANAAMAPLFQTTSWKILHLFSVVYWRKFMAKTSWTTCATTSSATRGTITPHLEIRGGHRYKNVGCFTH